MEHDDILEEMDRRTMLVDRRLNRKSGKPLKAWGGSRAVNNSKMLKKTLYQRRIARARDTPCGLTVHFSNEVELIIRSPPPTPPDARVDMDKIIFLMRKRTAENALEPVLLRKIAQSKLAVNDQKCIVIDATN